MAGGTSIWVSSEAKTDPKAIFNLRLLYLLVAVSWAGSFYGFDTGNIGGILTLPSFKNAFGMSGVTQSELDNRKVSREILSHDIVIEYLDSNNLGNNCEYARSRWICRLLARSANI